MLLNLSPIGQKGIDVKILHRFFVFGPVFFGIAGFAQAHEHGKSKAKSHHAHEHGSAKLNIVVESKKISMEFESPSESIYGFEHEAKSAKDKLKVETAVQKFKQNLQSAFVFDKQLNCQFEIAKIEPWVKEEGHGSGDHSEFHAEIVANCAAAPTGTKMNLGLYKLFPALRQVRIQLLNGDKQLGLEVKNDKGEISL
jgi:hypothetical protein